MQLSLLTPLTTLLHFFTNISLFALSTPPTNNIFSHSIYSIDFGFRSFRCSAPAIWNAIPLEIRSPLYGYLQTEPKTHFFRFPTV
jgi:hypothetical protein